jgi:hypothetical protein
MAMRHLLIGGDQQHIDLDDPHAGNASLSAHLALQLDAALHALHSEDARAARVAELHYFVGLPLERVDELLGVGRRTAERD